MGNYCDHDVSEMEDCVCLECHREEISALKTALENEKKLGRLFKAMFLSAESEVEDLEQKVVDAEDSQPMAVYEAIRSRIAGLEEALAEEQKCGFATSAALEQERYKREKAEAELARAMTLLREINFERRVIEE